jgi:hypothetical protein
MRVPIVRSLPVLFSGLGAIAAFAKLLPVTPNTVMSIAVEYASFALAMSLGAAIVLRPAPSWLSSPSRIFVGMFGSALTLLTFQASLVNRDWLSSPLIGSAVAIVDASAALLGAAFAVSRFRNLQYCALALAGSIVGVVFSALASAYGVPFHLYFFVPTAILGACLGSAFQRATSANQSANHPSPPHARRHIPPPPTNLDLAASTTIVAPLDDYERTLERVGFLTAVASAFLLAFISVALGLLAVMVADLLLKQGTLTEWIPLSAVVLVCLLLAWFALGILRRGRVILACFFGVGIALLGLWNVQKFVSLASCNEGLFPLFASWWCETAALKWRLFLVVPLLIPISFGLRIVLDGLRFTISPPSVRNVAAMPAWQHITKSFAPVLGVHPICRWLPGRLRRFAASGLFIFSSFVLSGVIVAMILFTYFVSIASASEIVSCALFDGPAANYPKQCVSVMDHIVVIFPGYFCIAVAIASALRLFARRLARVSMEQLSEIDKRPPVLFLRSFLDDQVELPRPKRSFWHSLMAVGDPLPSLDHVLLEEATPLGPVVAIGVPGAPAPFGAARLFTDDSSWQAAITKLADRAKAIVVVVDDTEGVLWELAHIRAAGHAAKTLFLLPPRLMASAEANRIVARELGHAAGELAASSGSDDRNTCVGWHRNFDGTNSLFAAGHPSRLSYACALRLAFKEP